MIKTLLFSALVAYFLTESTASPVISEPFARRATPTSAVSVGISISAPTYVSLQPAQVTSLQRELLMVPTQLDREAILFPGASPNGTNSANNVTFQFMNTPFSPPQAGNVVVGSVENIPGLIGTDVAFAVGFISPCGLNVPHLHPRANEFLTVVDGLLIGAFVLEEDHLFLGELPSVAMTLTNFTGMLFPKGHFHWQFNPTCKNATFAAGFDSNDEGRIQVAQTFFSIDTLTTQSATGNNAFLGPSQLAALQNNIPPAFSEQIKACAVACGLPTS